MSLVMGGVTFTPIRTTPPSSGYVIGIEADDTTFGNPTIPEVIVRSLLSQGAIVKRGTAENREAVLRVEVEGADSEQLALGEAALADIEGIRTTLVYTHEDGASVATVFDVITSRLEHDLDWDDEKRLARRYRFILTMLPWPRSADLVETPSVTPTAPVETVVHDGTTTTGWSTDKGSLSNSGGALVLTGPGGTSGASLTTLTYSPAVSWGSGDNYLVVDWLVTPGTSEFFVTTATGNQPRAMTVDSGSGYNRTYFSGEAADFASGFDIELYTPSLTYTFGIDQVFTSDKLPSTGTGRQRLATLTPGGTARTEGTIVVEHASAALGDVFVYTFQDDRGYSPPTSPYFTAAVSGASTITDATTYSGSRWVSNDSSDGIRNLIPSGLLPTGTYSIWVRMRHDSLSDEVLQTTWMVSTWINTTRIYGLGTERNTYSESMPASTYKWVCLGEAVLPPAHIGTDGFVGIEFYGNSGGTFDTHFDECLIFHEDGQLSMIEAGTTTPSPGSSARRLRISPASLTVPRPVTTLGYATDWTDEYAAAERLISPGNHYFEQPQTKVFTTSLQTDAETSLEHYRRWISFAAE